MKITSQFLPLENQDYSGLIVELSCLIFVLFLGLWTLLTNGVVFLGGSFTNLFYLSPLVLLIMAVSIVLVKPLYVKQEDGEIKPASDLKPNNTMVDLVIPLLGAIAIVSVYSLTNNTVIFWLLTCGFLGFYYIRYHKSETAIALQSPAPGNLFVFLALLAAAAIATLVVYRTHGDDAFYLNMIAGALDFPNEPLMSRDTMHGLSGIPMLIPVYRLHSIEMLAAVVSQATGISHLIVRNLLQPAIIEPFVVCASALLLRQLTPRHWLPIAAATTLLMIIFTVSVGLGNTSFGRLQQGKPLFVSILVPIIITYTIRCFTKPCWWHWGILGMAQIAAVGCTSTALYAAPITTVLTLAGCWYPTKKNTLKATIAFSAVFYPLLLSLIFFFKVKSNSPILRSTQFGIWDNDPELQLQHGPLAYLFWIAVLASWAVFEQSASRRVILGMVTAFMLVFFNPFLQEFWAVNLTGVPTFRRLWWAIPRHIFVALILGFPLLYPAFEKYRQKAFATFCGLLTTAIIILAANAAPNQYSPRIDYNRSLSYKWPPQAKLPTERLEVIAKIIATIPPRSYLLAPASPVGKEVDGEELARWSIVYRNHPYPIVVTEPYLDILVKFFGEKEVARRKELSQYISGVHRTEVSAQILRQSIGELNINAVVLPLENPWKQEIRQVLLSLELKAENIGKYQIWKR
ncbi:MAG TPA: hypothetical protein DCY88_14830 [Cyanobacteria bacterium UBA11372]|nr:hypothetical protein [Cyanobacteria bacterium UBA11372]